MREQTNNRLIGEYLTSTILLRFISTVLLGGISWHLWNQASLPSWWFGRKERYVLDCLKLGSDSSLQDYEYILGRYAAEWEILKAEVMLAVAIGHKPIDTEAADDFCSEVGFEFVDAGDGEDDETESKWPRFCRV